MLATNILTYCTFNGDLTCRKCWWKTFLYITRHVTKEQNALHHSTKRESSIWLQFFFFFTGLCCSLASPSQQERKVAGKLLLPPSSNIGYESTARKSFTERDLCVSDAFQTINPAIYAQSCFAIIFSPTNQKKHRRKSFFQCCPYRGKPP